jgi:hypothetical protein
MNSAVLRELGAEVRTFKTDSGCLLWFVQERARRMGIQVKLESGATPISREAREVQNATYASIAASLTEAAPSDYSFDPPITEERLNQLVHWYLSDEPQQSLADRLGMSWARFCREARRTRNVIRRRMYARGLIEGRQT